jgi:hypothetical protein
MSTQAIRAILLARATGGDLRRAPLKQPEEPRATRAVSLCVSEHRKTADDEKPSQVVITTLRYLSKALFAAARGLLRYQPDEGCKAPAIFEAAGIADRSNERAGSKWSYAWNRGETPARLVRFVPSHHLPVEFEDLSL